MTLLGAPTHSDDEGLRTSHALLRHADTSRQSISAIDVEPAPVTWGLTNDNGMYIIYIYVYIMHAYIYIYVLHLRKASGTFLTPFCRKPRVLDICSVFFGFERLLLFARQDLGKYGKIKNVPVTTNQLIIVPT